MTKDVLVALTGIQFAGETDESPIEVITAGEYFFRNDKHYVVYEETMEGTSGVIRNLIKFNENELTLTRSGAVNVEMLFYLGRKTMSSYRTPYGDLIIGIDTKRISISKREDHIDVEIAYSLDANYEFLSDCNLTMKIASRDCGIGLNGTGKGEK